MAASNSSQSTASPLTGKSILFVGGGTFGVSAAYHLAERLDLASSKTTITIADRFQSPSPIAASNDLNKIVRSDYSEPIYARLGIEAMSEWKKNTGIFAGMFKQTGWFLAAQSASIPFIEASVANQAKLGITGVRKVTAEETRQISPSFTGAMEGWQIWWNPWAGWTTSGEALAAMTAAAKQLGVKYVSGDDGWIKKLLYDTDGTCIGAEAANGTRHYADKVVVSAGATSPTLLDFEGQLQAKGHIVGHIQLTPQDADNYANLKIVDHFEQGILFPPNRDGLVKVATVNFVTNVENAENPGISLPRYREDHPRDDVPRKIEEEIRGWMREFVPELADKPWAETRICWDTDTQDLHFLIDKHPKHSGLYLATGGSAHGFKFLPIIGKYVADMLESKLDPSLAETWAWRPGRQRKKHGPDPHPFPVRDLAEFEDFKPTGPSRL